MLLSCLQGFNRINSCRSIPTMNTWNPKRYRYYKVSIVSIHADQSRLCLSMFSLFIDSGCFNRINSCRSIPTERSVEYGHSFYQVSFVSIHADQSRQLPLGSQSWRGSQRLNGGTYFFNRKMIKIYTVNLYKN